MSQPLRSTPITRASPLLRAGPPARAASVLNAVRFPPSSALPLDAGHKHAAISIDTGLSTFHASAADQARAAFTPDTAWPVNRHPPGSSRRLLDSPVSMSTSLVVSTLHRTVRFRSPSWSPPDGSRAPFPHRSPRGPQPTQHEAV